MSMWTDETHTEKKLREEKRYLESELEDARRRENERSEQESREREQRRREWKAEFESNYRTATTWPEALSKQASLSRKEIFPGDDSSDYFAQTAEACDKALEIWPEVAAEREDELESLRRQIRTIETEIRDTVALRLSAENESNAWRQVAQALRADYDKTEWLNW